MRNTTETCARETPEAPAPPYTTLARLRALTAAGMRQQEAGMRLSLCLQREEVAARTHLLHPVRPAVVVVEVVVVVVVA